MHSPEYARRHSLPLIVLTALSLSVGWGIRGNFGHEYGAMIPGALATMGAVLLCDRKDWWPRIPCFGFLGALGWSFGGSISYMQVIGYTHSGHSPSVLYGFACLFVIGFLWAAMGGAGAGLVAVLDREKLAELLMPLTTVFAAWWLQDFVTGFIESNNSDFRQASPLYWYDTDWLAALVALTAILLLAAVRRRWDGATSLIAHMAIGWWISFLLLVVWLGIRMTPPRGDNWAGCLGMTAGLWVFLQRRGYVHVTIASAICGFIGGFGFATATLFKLIEVKSGWETNWHSVLEQTYGLINGLGVACAVLFLARRAPPISDPPRSLAWLRIYSVAFVLLGVTFLNLRKNPTVWTQAKSVPDLLYTLPPGAWFDLAYLVLGSAMVALLFLHRRQRLPFIPESAVGQGQLLYLVFLWWVVMGNFERALVRFAPQRLITEGVIFFNAVLCTVLLLASPRFRTAVETLTPARLRQALRRILSIGLVGTALSLVADWGVVRAIYGDTFAGHAALHIRFGPRATASSDKPKANQPHP